MATFPIAACLTLIYYLMCCVAGHLLWLSSHGIVVSHPTSNSYNTTTQSVTLNSAPLSIETNRSTRSSATALLDCSIDRCWHCQSSLTSATSNTYVLTHRSRLLTKLLRNSRSSASAVSFKIFGYGMTKWSTRLSCGLIWMHSSFRWPMSHLQASSH